LFWQRTHNLDAKLWVLLDASEVGHDSVMKVDSDLGVSAIAGVGYSLEC
jgi:hypothetical protein